MLLHFKKIIKNIFMRIKNFLFVLFFTPSIYVFAEPVHDELLEETREVKFTDPELEKLLDEAQKLREEGEEDDAVDEYKKILDKYDLTLLDKTILFDIRKYLAYYYFSKEKYPEAQKYFALLVRDSSIKEDELQDAVYKLCLSIYSQLPSRAEVDLTKCYELRNAFRTFSRYVKDKKIFNHMNEMCKEALSLVDEQKCLFAEYYFDKGYYSSALFLCDKYLMDMRDNGYIKRLLVLKLKTLTALADLKSFYSFSKFFESIKSKYSDIYSSNIREFENLHLAFIQTWDRRLAPMRNIKN